MPFPLIIGHRGASAVAPENTMAAFREAIAVGAHGIEFDVRLTRDGIPVVIHDSTLGRTGGVNQRVSDLSWEELRKIDVGSWFKGGSFAGETVPSLEELFDLFQTNNLSLYLEMKCDSPAEYRPLAEACCRMIHEHSLIERVVVECFQLPALESTQPPLAQSKNAHGSCGNTLRLTACTPPANRTSFRDTTKDCSSETDRTIPRDSAPFHPQTILP